jgi:AcrR family transcriptional regulator
MGAVMAGNTRIDIGRIRRDQIVEAAVAVIAEQGIQNLSLSEIEKKVGMSRGQLTYYFKSKEDILLGVFDRLVEMMRGQRGGGGDQPPPELTSWQGVVRMVLQAILQEPQSHPEFGPLQYTFLSQISHREDFRQRLAGLYEDWRLQMSELVGDKLSAGRKKVSPRTFASLVQAMFHGVAIQIAADPGAFHRQEMLALCLDMLGSYLQGQPKTQSGRGAAGHKSKKEKLPGRLVNGVKK